MNWSTTYKAVFGRRLDDEDVSEWERLLDASFRKGIDRSWEDEIIPALEAIGESQRSVGRGKHPPDFSEVKTAIIRARYNANGEREKPRQVGDHDCPFCRDGGQMTWYPDIQSPYPPFGAAWIEKVRTEQVFCVCSKGQTLAADAHFNINSPVHRQAQEEAKSQYRAIHGEPEPAKGEAWEP
jgi:hypothetical protein